LESDKLTTTECAKRLSEFTKFASNYFEATGKPVASLSFTRDMLYPVQYAATAMSKLAAGELVEVVHGKWINFVGDFSTAECDKCGELYEVSPDGKPCEDYFNAFKQFYKHCPSCGALMDADMGNHMTGKDDNNAEIH
jgi:hypothetical protein